MAKDKMTKEDQPIVETTDKPELSKEELEAQSGEQLPDREQQSLVNANLALPINAAVAANVLSDGSIAYADAAQGNTIEQGNIPQDPAASG
jgi:hypothetical protein